jgi:hypothetical protein
MSYYCKRKKQCCFYNNFNNPLFRLGGVGDIYFSLLQMNNGEKFAEIKEPLMIVAGDTLFARDFQLSSVVDKYNSLLEQYEQNQSFAVVLCYQLKDHNEVSKRGSLFVFVFLKKNCRFVNPHRINRNC